MEENNNLLKILKTLLDQCGNEIESFSLKGCGLLSSLTIIPRKVVKVEMKPSPLEKILNDKDLELKINGQKIPCVPEEKIIYFENGKIHFPNEPMPEDEEIFPEKVESLYVSSIISMKPELIVKQLRNKHMYDSIDLAFVKEALDRGEEIVEQITYEPI